MKECYLLFGGTSPDGRGELSYVGRTESKGEAARHYKKVKSSPYSIGKVMIVNDSEFKLAFLSDFVEL